MDLEKLRRELRDRYENSDAPTLDARIEELVKHIERDDAPALSQEAIQLVVQTVLDAETRQLQSELETLLAEKERIDRRIERTNRQLQEEKHTLFNALDEAIGERSPEAHAILHQVKLRSIDLFDMLEEMIETAIITTLEKTTEIEETIEEITREITYETLNEGPLETGRIRMVLGAILHRAVGVGEATPNQAEPILRGTLLGVRSGLIKAIQRLKKQLLFMPEELKLTETMPTELLRTDSLFTQIIHDEALRCEPESRQLLDKLAKEIRYDLGELVEVSRETVDVMKEQLSQMLQRSKLLNSKTAEEAKRMGVSAWRSAKSALGHALGKKSDERE